MRNLVKSERNSSNILMWVCIIFLFAGTSCKQTQNKGCIIYSNDFENYVDWGFNHYLLRSGESHSGRYHCYTDSLNRYGMGLILPLKSFENCKPTKLVMSCWVKCMKQDNGSSLVATFDEDATSLTWYGLDLSKEVKEFNVWTFVSAEYSFPSNLPEESVFKFFLWNNGSDPVLVDDMTVEFFQ